METVFYVILRDLRFTVDIGKPLNDVEKGSDLIKFAS